MPTLTELTLPVWSILYCFQSFPSSLDAVHKASESAFVFCRWKTGTEN